MSMTIDITTLPVIAPDRFRQTRENAHAELDAMMRHMDTQIFSTASAAYDAGFRGTYSPIGFNLDRLRRTHTEANGLLPLLKPVTFQEGENASAEWMDGFYEFAGWLYAGGHREQYRTFSGAYDAWTAQKGGTDV